MKSNSPQADPSDLLSWPAVPVDQRPKLIYHAGLIDKTTAAVLTERGWEPVDVRLLPNRTDDDRRVALKAFLEGLRFGTIEMDPKQAKWVELETKVYEIHKGVVGKPTDTLGEDSETVDSMLQFGSTKPFSTPVEERAKKTKKIKGRKKDSAKESTDSDQQE